MVTVDHPSTPGTTVLYCTLLYCTVLYCTVLYRTVLYCTTHIHQGQLLKLQRAETSWEPEFGRTFHLILCGTLLLFFSLNVWGPPPLILTDLLVFCAEAGSLGADLAPAAVRDMSHYQPGSYEHPPVGATRLQLQVKQHHRVFGRLGSLPSIVTVSNMYTIHYLHCHYSPPP